jgi:putative FmdB family regulatory protein
MPFVVDYECLLCGNCWEVWLDSSDQHPVGCPKCSSKNVQRCLGGVATRCHDPAVRSEVLKQRSLEHTQRTAKRNVERIIAKSKR